MILVSACLLGCACRYDGKSKENAFVLSLLQKHEWIPVGPEQLGGLSTPRPCAERRGDRVVTSEGRDVTEHYQRGAREALRIYRMLGCEAAVLKARSPSCGSRHIYDGTFSGCLTPDDGVTAALLKENGIAVYGESEIEALLAQAGPEEPQQSLF